VVSSRATLKDHKYFIVDWIRLEALFEKAHQHSWVKIVFSFQCPCHAANNHSFQLRNVDLRVQQKKLLSAAGR
jgi:hypothetical protein